MCVFAVDFLVRSDTRANNNTENEPFRFHMEIKAQFVSGIDDR